MDISGWVVVGMVTLGLAVFAVREIRRDKALRQLQRKQDETHEALVTMGWVLPEREPPRRKRTHMRGLPVWAGVLGAAGWLVGQSRAHAKALAASAGVAMVAALSSPMVLTPSPDDDGEAAAPPALAPQAPPSTTAPTSVAPEPSRPAVSPSIVQPHPSTSAPSPLPAETPEPEVKPQVSNDVPAPSDPAPVAPQPRAPHVPTTPAPSPVVAPPDVPPPLEAPSGCRYVVTVNGAPLAQARLLCI